jgi:hypothetical protein
MPRKKLLRRFEPRYGVSQAALDVEAKYLGREAEDYETLAPSDVETKLIERHANCKHSWEQLQLLIESVPERNQRILNALLFRDFYHILELYLTYLRSAHSQAAISTRSPAKHLAPASSSFSEWLFDLSNRKE